MAVNLNKLAPTLGFFFFMHNNVY